MDNKSVFSVSRDKTVKQTDVATQRFIGNVTTHTPGVLARRHARHRATSQTQRSARRRCRRCKPKLFRMATKAAPAGGGNPNQIREYAGTGRSRVFDVKLQRRTARACSPAAVIDNTGQVRAFETDSGKQVWTLPIEGTRHLRACSFARRQNDWSASGGDGQIRLLDAIKGTAVPKRLFLLTLSNKAMKTRGRWWRTRLIQRSSRRNRFPLVERSSV